MKNKIIRILSILAAVLIFIALTLWFWNYFFIEEKEIKPVDQPISSMPEFPQTKIGSIGDAKDREDIAQAFDEFIIKSKDSKESLVNMTTEDSAGAKVIIDNFLIASNSRIDQSLNKYLDSSKYEIFSCLLSNGKTANGIVINVGRSQDFNYSILQQDVEKAISNWEPMMLKDLHNVLFPKVNFSEDDLSQKIVFKEGEYRFAEIILPEGEKASINYEVFGDPIIITSELECLNKKYEELIDI